MKIGVLMYTYNRTDDARINMEIIRNVWSQNDLLKDVKIVHSFNGKKEWWPEKYLEDELIYLENPGHFEGAEILMNAGVKVFQDKYSDLDYIIILASDTWLVKPDWLVNVITQMKNKELYMAGSVWGTKKKNSFWEKGISLDLNILDSKWVKKSSLFPIRFKEFKDKYFDIFTYRNETIYLEILFITRFLEAISRTVKVDSDNMVKTVSEKYIYRIEDREPVHMDSMENFLFKKGQYVRKMY